MSKEELTASSPSSTSAGTAQPTRIPLSSGEQLGAKLLPGAQPLPNGHTRFRVWSTRAREVAVRIAGEDHPLSKSSDPDHDGIFQATLPFGSGTRYQFVLDGEVTPDPYARFLPDGVHGEAEVIDDTAYEWHDVHWNGLALEGCIFYELHIGTFTPEGTYKAAQEKLPELKALGITAVELMPLAAYAGEYGWGYDGVAFYAPHAPYGRPEDLKAFVDAAHRLGLGVFLDVVYNHFGPDGNFLQRYSPEYFTERYHTPWGAGLDYRERHMRRLITENARMWLSDYHFDGLRLDATQSIQDDSDVHILQELASSIHALNGQHLMIAEDYRNLPMLVSDYHLDGIWVDDFHHEMRVTLTGDQDGYYAAFQGGAAALANVINRGWAYEGQRWPIDDENLPDDNRRGQPADNLEAPNFVYFIQNHDQIGNRAKGDRVTDLDRVSDAAFRGASTLLLSLPMTPLIFQGQEWGASTPFPFFSNHHGELGAQVSEGRKKEFGDFEGFLDEVLDPQDRATFEAAKLNWQERQEGEHAKTFQLYQDMLALRKSDPVLRQRSRRALSAGHLGEVLWVRRQTNEGERVLLLNTGKTAVQPAQLQLPFDLPSALVFHSEQRSTPHLGAGEAVILGEG
ncbi:malto-oligosyltrehalose trehalohydrolase [Deinococcus irradiatisoli]|uniref:Malto-oligosyltrehalose trehalohydrolase n=1 Tax=Deinococcus irradiatisoli TaxID=2202254 RepID=A0A2Z3JBQ0_9DEIO|nr:malto-oligosyltrehalose trehalohydrolase [Deinococcus irradiatisoli]AWN22577.1 malto-oligosyltrehalose trehalohydrolase [Deinococcus irradiatisoli]